MNGYRLVKDTSAKLDTAAYRIEAVISGEDFDDVTIIEGSLWKPQKPHKSN